MGNRGVLLFGLVGLALPALTMGLDVANSTSDRPLNFLLNCETVAALIAPNSDHLSAFMADNG